MIIRLEPPHGVPPLLIGMSIDESRDAVALWGDVEELPATPGRAFALRARDEDLTRDVFAYFEDGAGGGVTAVEVWRPEPATRPGANVQVRYGELDVFGLPADDVLRILRDRGVEVDESDPFYPSCPRLLLGFNREGGAHADEETGMARFFESVLVSYPGYDDPERLAAERMRLEEDLRWHGIVPPR